MKVENIQDALVNMLKEILAGHSFPSASVGIGNDIVEMKAYKKDGIIIIEVTGLLPR